MRKGRGRKEEGKGGGGLEEGGICSTRLMG